MGYRGKVLQQEQARQLRGQGLTLTDIATQLGVAKSSVSLWVRGVEFEPLPRVRARQREPNILARRKQEEIDRLLVEGRNRVGDLSEREFLMAGTALYAGEGAKRDGAVLFANSDPRLIVFFCQWLRRFFAVDESRLRARLYLHDGLDLEGATRFWEDATGVPQSQFGAPYRAPPDATIRTAKHVRGCISIRYSCSRTHRGIMGLISAVFPPADGTQINIPG